jgi:hypothetical protein
VKLKEFLDEWSMSSLKIKTPFLESEWKPADVDKDAAWELYVELLTRIATQPLPAEHGDEQTALESIHQIFGITREIIKSKGRHCINFAKIAIIVLNQKIRPFTARWHKLSLSGAFKDDVQCKAFRNEMLELQKDLKNYTRLLAELADVEDLTEMEQD